MAEICRVCGSSHVTPQIKKHQILCGIHSRIHSIGQWPQLLQRRYERSPRASVHQANRYGVNGLILVRDFAICNLGCNPKVDIDVEIKLHRLGGAGAVLVVVVSVQEDGSSLMHTYCTVLLAYVTEDVATAGGVGEASKGQQLQV